MTPDFPALPLSEEDAQWFMNLSSDAQKLFEEITALTERLPLDKDGLLRVVECQERCVARLSELATWEGPSELTGAVSGLWDVFKAIWDNLEVLFGTGIGLPQGTLRARSQDSWRKRRFGHPQARVFILPDRLSVQVHAASTKPPDSLPTQGEPACLRTGAQAASTTSTESASGWRKLLCVSR